MGFQGFRRVSRKFPVVYVLSKVLEKLKTNSTGFKRVQGDLKRVQGLHVDAGKFYSDASRYRTFHFSHFRYHRLAEA